MSIDGRVIVDALFYDRDGTAAMNVLSLQGDSSHTAVKAAVITGTVGESLVPLALQPSTYRDASGSLVSFSTVSGAAIKAEGNNIVLHRYPEFAGYLGEGSSFAGTLVRAGKVCVVSLDNTDLDPFASASPALQCPGGTASFTVIIYGT